jgi:hypothetical protein
MISMVAMHTTQHRIVMDVSKLVVIPRASTEITAVLIRLVATTLPVLGVHVKSEEETKILVSARVVLT